MTEFPPRLILANAFSRDSFGDQPVWLCLAPRESRWRPIFRTPAHDPIKSEWLNFLQKIPV
jgi:hypothetical protein